MTAMGFTIGDHTHQETPSSSALVRTWQPSFWRSRRRYHYQRIFHRAGSPVDNIENMAIIGGRSTHQLPRDFDLQGMVATSTTPTSRNALQEPERCPTPGHRILPPEWRAQLRNGPPQRQAAAVGRLEYPYTPSAAIRGAGGQGPGRGCRGGFVAADQIRVE